MKNIKSIYAIITARGGSKGVPKKNIKLLNGYPLIYYTIEAAKDCKYINKTIVTTDDLEIAKISKKYKAEVIIRPKKLAKDNTLSRDVVLHALKYLEKKHDLPEYFVLLQPTSPLRTSKHLTKFIKEFMKYKYNSGFSITNCDYHPYKTFRKINKNKYIPMKNWACHETPRQQLPDFYKPNGAIYLMNTNLFFKKQKFIIPNSYKFYMNNFDSIDVDTQLDFKIIESIMNS